MKEKSEKFNDFTLLKQIELVRSNGGVWDLGPSIHILPKGLATPVDNDLIVAPIILPVQKKYII